MSNLERGGPIVRGTTALAGWARYLGVVLPEHQSFDASIVAARHYGAKALTDPVSFLDYAEVFPTELRDSKRFRAAFTAAYQCIEQHGPLAAMAMPEH